MLSIGTQGGTSIQHPDRYSGSHSSSANTGIQQQATRGAQLTQQLGNYIITSPQAMTAIRYETPQHYAMTATVMQHNQRVDIFGMPISTFDQMPLWILQRLAIASIDPSGVADTSLLQGITQNANDVLVSRIEQGEELKHDTLTRVVGHVDGQGQCFIDTRNLLNKIDDGPKISRNAFINDLIDKPEQLLGLETAQCVFKSEYDVDISRYIESDFISEYVDGKWQSGFSELWYAVKQDNKHYVVVSSVEGESWCAVTAIFPGYGDCQCNDIAVVKAGVISVEQLKTSMILLSHGALINPHVLAQLTHFAPVTLSTEIKDEDLLNQCCICLSPDVSHIKDHPSGQNAMDTSGY